jgi:hypothetical protein
MTGDFFDQVATAAVEELYVDVALFEDKRLIPACRRGERGSDSPAIPKTDRNFPVLSS